MAVRGEMVTAQTPSPYGGGRGPAPRFSGRQGMGGSQVPASAAFGPGGGGGGRGTNLQGSQAGPYGGSFSQMAGPGARRGSMAGGRSNRYDQSGVVAGGGTNVNAVQQARMQGPDPAAIEAEMKRRQMGAQMGPQNAALAGYMMG